jgi:hypothetical protein
LKDLAGDVNFRLSYKLASGKLWAAMFGWLRKRNDNVQVAAANMKAASEGAERARAVRAMATIDIQVDPTLNNLKFCVKAVVAIIRNLAKTAEHAPIWLDDDRRFVAGIFAFTLSNSLSYRLGTPFEVVASSSALILIAVDDEDDGDSDFRDVDDIASVYNDLTTNGRIIEAIGTTFSKWLLAPNLENYKSLVALYSLLRKNVSPKD